MEDENRNDNNDLNHDKEVTLLVSALVDRLVMMRWRVLLFKLNGRELKSVNKESPDFWFSFLLLRVVMPLRG
jgi:hypothetical protein